MADSAAEDNEPPVRELDEDDISLLKTYGLGPYASRIDNVSKDIKDITKRVHDACGIKESDTGLAAPSRWDLVSDKQMQQEEQPLQVLIAQCLIALWSGAQLSFWQQGQPPRTTPGST